MRAILQYDHKGTFIKEWDSAPEAGKAAGTVHIKDACVGNLKSARGFQWRYKRYEKGEYCPPLLVLKPTTCVAVDIARPQLHKYFRETIPDKKMLSIMSYNKLLATFGAVSKRFFQLVMEDVLLKSKRVKLPYSLGSIQVKKYKTIGVKLKVDFNATRLAGKTIYHLNEHRDGYSYRFLWAKTKKTPNRRFYSFIPTDNDAGKSNKEKLVHILKNNMEIDYFEQEKYYHGKR